MTQEDKELLLKELCAKFPYGIKVHFDCCEPHISEVDEIINIIRTKETSDYSQGVIVAEINSVDPFLPLDEIKPYLYPMSSMTKEEHAEFYKVGGLISHKVETDTYVLTAFSPEAYDWLNAHHFDYRGLIEKGLALEVTKDNNPYKE